jgi:hypothetical protein
MDMEKSFCPMIDDTCPGEKCVLWGDPLAEGCILTSAYRSLINVNQHLATIVEKLEHIGDGAEDVAHELLKIQNSSRRIEG